MGEKAAMISNPYLSLSSVEAVERGLNPLKDMIAVVGDLSRRGSVVLAASPAIKDRYGIKTGSRLYEIPDDPRIYVVPARMALYIERSMQILNIVHRFVPAEAIQPYSIDELFFTTLHSERLFGSIHDVAMSLKRTVYKELGLLLAVGIGPNKFLAKVILDNYAKKTGLAAVTYADIPAVLWPLPIQDVWGIGRRMQLNLNRLGIYRLGDLAKAPLSLLRSRYGVIGEQLYYHAWGVDLSPVIVDPYAEARKGFSTGVTLMRDYNKLDALIVIYELTDQITAKLRRYRLAAFTVSLSIRYSNKEPMPGYHKSRTLYAASCLSVPFLEVLQQLLHASNDGLIRHISISVSNLVEESAVQLDLFDSAYHEKLRRLSRTTDAIQQRHGSAAILRAISLTDAGIALNKSHKIGGHYE
ncbi:DNA polymerase V (plasmid) [Paenibacillus bovis]|uniref:DNA polymerase V n=2 Tax=Paenibacillus bovis TaxID=1616788 RepID=A0A1X9T427_9BACL|nr:DNA polymerase V [Paenibacillus bovis]